MPTSTSINLGHPAVVHFVTQLHASQFRSGLAVHEYLLAKGFEVVRKYDERPERGVMLFYASPFLLRARFGLLVRIKTRGGWFLPELLDAGDRHDRPWPHMDVSWADGRANGHVDMLRKKDERCMYNYRGRPEPPKPPGDSFDSDTAWGDRTHQIFFEDGFLHELEDIPAKRNLLDAWSRTQ